MRMCLLILAVALSAAVGGQRPAAAQGGSIDASLGAIGSRLAEARAERGRRSLGDTSVTVKQQKPPCPPEAVRLLGECADTTTWGVNTPIPRAQSQGDPGDPSLGWSGDRQTLLDAMRNAGMREVSPGVWVNQATLR